MRGALPHATAIVSESPGSVLTQVLLRAAMDGRPGAPRLTAEGAHVELPRGWLRGRGEIVLTAEGDGTRLRLVGQPPRWPLSLGWGRRTLRRLLGGRAVHWVEEDVVDALPPDGA